MFSGVAAFDAVFVGSGVNSLTGAALLSRSGWRVLVLERNDVLGGSIRTSGDLTERRRRDEPRRQAGHEGAAGAEVPRRGRCRANHSAAPKTPRERRGFLARVRRSIHAGDPTLPLSRLVCSAPWRPLMRSSWGRASTP